MPRLRRRDAGQRPVPASNAAAVAPRAIPTTHDRLASALHTAGLSVHGYAGQTLERPLPPIETSLSGEAGGSVPGGAADAPGRQWLYSGGGYSVLQLLVEELTGRPFADVMQTEILDALGMTTSSFQWHRTAATACPHDAEGGRIPRVLLRRAGGRGAGHHRPDPTRFVAAALPGPRGRASGARGARPGRGAAGPHRRPRH
jgi:CubicO group peptidase (beta-lactamase class C family)